MDSSSCCGDARRRSCVDGDVSRAFSGWEAKVSEVRRMRAVGTKIAERWMRSSMADFFFAWFQLSRGKCRRRGRLPRSSFVL